MPSGGRVIVLSVRAIIRDAPTQAFRDGFVRGYDQGYRQYAYNNDGYRNDGYYGNNGGTATMVTT